MRFYAHEKLALMVDGPNTSATAKALALDIDWGKLQEFFARQALLATSCYFTPLQNAKDFDPARRLADWMDFNGWRVMPCQTDVAVDLAVAVMEMSQWIDHFVIATCNEDFVCLVDALKRQGRRVTILSTREVPPSIDDLRRAADDFIELESLRPNISRVAKVQKSAVPV